ncbi:hypothetical protein D5041_09975 [Verminephrobacter aporrectodeae subsp. tuberculatae]|uniref:PIN domain-containing protein n=1 Tax=Verminephrobacter aporrectodeae subsp. tuberculatae TaxID=1110392 RepID=A0ABT3KT34_9BURK|nr:hypothetical protein [Verminephrobacter aporrectodeae]MCW5220087.1 hypothetical protein [Verminephrobacter aporrectodeae subsp. tuberculatae]MCW5289375.1 hypothetical protein [Verminephrobacter aporrectodeae subsp. tuberculatae]MCW5320960.1 hypothetical protein [Verminephrobacter aporrectodeae subsp. tuberculatae]
MSSIVLVDTTILLNVLNVPGRNQRREKVFGDFKRRFEDNDCLFIPLAAIIETGNHIAHVSNGHLRRQAAENFVEAVRGALNGSAPWKPMNFPSHEDLSEWLLDFPDSAMKKVGMGDLSIQKEWEQLCIKYPMSRVLIWSLDNHLQSFDRSG